MSDATRVLVDELVALRVAFREASERFAARVEAELALVEKRIEEPGRRLHGPALDLLARRVRSLDLKPAKGRLKDLIRVREVAEELLAALEP